MDEWFSFGVEQTRLFWRMNGLVWSGPQDNQQTFQHGSRLAQHWMMCVLFLGLTAKMGNLHIAEMKYWVFVGCSMFQPTFWERYVPLNSDGLIVTLANIFLTISTPLDDLRWVLRWIPEKSQTPTVAVGFHLRWMRFYLNCWTLYKMFHCQCVGNMKLKHSLEIDWRHHNLSFITQWHHVLSSSIIVLWFYD